MPENKAFEEFEKDRRWEERDIILKAFAEE